MKRLLFASLLTSSFLFPQIARGEARSEPQVVRSAERHRGNPVRPAPVYNPRYNPVRYPVYPTYYPTYYPNYYPTHYPTYNPTYYPVFQWQYGGYNTYVCFFGVCWYR